MQVATPKKGYKLVKTSFGKYEEIPEEWKVEKLIDLCNEKPKYGANSSAIEHDTSLPRYVRITDILQDGSLRKDKIVSIQEDEAKKYLLKEGDIVFARSGSIGLTYLYKKEDGRCAFAGYLIRFVPNQTKVNIKFLSHYTRSHIYWKWISSTKTTATISNVNAEQYSKMPIVLPPLPEQQQIASILSNVDDTIQKTDQIIKQTQRLKKGMMQKLLTRGIGHSKFKKVPWLFGKEIEIPEEWEITQLKNSVKEIITYGIVQAGPSINNGIPYVRTSDMKGDKLTIHNMLRTSKEIASKFQRSTVRKEELVFAIRATVGKVLAVPEELDGANLTQGTARISPNDNFDNDFVMYSLRNNYVKKQINRVIKGTTFLEITLHDLREIKILKPLLPEQQQIASILSNIDTQIQKEKIHKSNLERLKKGLMQKLLTGQIRVMVR
jgi:type I restriction enzyme, S subunit